eukprot:XP_014788432.1 PREDICTED: uncharacterized protein LOC106882313 [Octopus bimaculoides]
MSRRASMFSFLGVSDEDIHSSIKLANRDASLKGRLKRVIIKDSTARRVAIIFDLIIRLIACLLYVIRVIIDDQQEYDCCSDVTQVNEEIVTTKLEQQAHGILHVLNDYLHNLKETGQTMGFDSL